MQLYKMRETKKRMEVKRGKIRGIDKDMVNEVKYTSN